MFDIAEISAFSNGPFSVLTMDDDCIELISDTTNQFWMVKKFNKEGYPPVVLYHSHNGERYHVHFVYEVDNALLCYSEIVQHDKYILKREKRRAKITRLSNKELVAAAYA